MAPYLHSRLSLALPAVSLKGGSYLRRGILSVLHLDSWMLNMRGINLLWHFPSPSTCALGFHVWLLLIPSLCWHPEHFPKCKISSTKPPTKMGFAILNLSGWMNLGEVLAGGWGSVQRVGGVICFSCGLPDRIWCLLFKMQSLQAVQAPVSGNESLDLAPAEAPGSFPPFSLQSAYLWCLYPGSQFALFSIFLNRLHHQIFFFFFFCLWHGKEKGKKSQGEKKNTSSQEKEKAKQILPPKQRSQSSFISTFNLHWDFPICWCWKVHWILAEVQVLKYLLFF